MLGKSKRTMLSILTLKMHAVWTETVGFMVKVLTTVSAM